jgi:hypothetical protein
MKYIKKIFESLDISKEDILDNFIHITDNFGEPNIVSSEWGKLTKWEISWDIKLNLSKLQSANEFILKFKKLNRDMDDILATQDRLENHNLNISLDNKLHIELIPKDTGDNNYKFISHFRYRTLYIKMNEIERFLNSKGMRITEYDRVEHDEYDSLEIYIANINEGITEFVRLINIEMDDLSEKYGCYHINPNIIVIRPRDVRCYIEITK